MSGKKVTEQWERDLGARHVYSNFVHLNWSLFDIIIRFGQVVPREPRETGVRLVEERAAVTLAWPEAKALRDILTGAIDKYEKANGAIIAVKLP